MHPERWRRIKELVDVSLRLEGAERGRYLDRVCEGDASLREEVESLIAAYEDSGDLLEETAPFAAPRDPFVGARLGTYRIIEEIGSGGMGTVYRAVRDDEEFQKEVAVKVVRRGLHLDYIVRRFRLERQIMATLEHPNIATLMDGGSTQDGLPYFVMEYIRGKRIDAYCREKKLELRECLELFRTVCAAVEFAHSRGVIHRDIKPGNILVNESGAPKLLDFGIAKLLRPEGLPAERDATATVGPAMTPEYASPEQLAGEPVTPASDVYSLGLLLCELLAGKRPFAPPSGTRPTGETAPPELPSRLANRRELAGDLDNIVLMAVRTEPERRYPSAGALEEDIRRYLEGRPVRACKDSLAYRAAKYLRRQKAAIMAATLSAALLLSVYFGIQWWEARSDSGAAPSTIFLTTTPGREFQPYFAPDGRRVVYSAVDESGTNTDVFIQPLTGAPVRRLTTNEAADVSPVWSPDGARIAWLRTGPKETAIFVSPAKGGVHGKVADVFPTRVETVGRHLDWSPDGRYLAAADKNGPTEPFRIVLIGSLDGRKQNATSPPVDSIGDMSPAFSPDGKNLAFIRALSSGINEIFVAPIGGGTARQITFDKRDAGSVAWTRDGRSIVFSSNRQGSAALWRVPAGGGPPVRVPLVSENATDPSFSRDGRKMVYAQLFEDTNIWRVATDGGTAPTGFISSTRYDSSPQYSPDGTRVAFRSNRSGSTEIWVSDAHGRNATQLTRFGGPLAGSPRWSPDGKEIVFDARPDGQPEIYAIPAIGGAVRRITNSSAEDVVPSWSQDGKWIYFASNRSGTWQVWRVPAGGGGEEQVTIQGGFMASEVQDGKTLLYAKSRNGPGLWRKRLPDGVEEPALEELRPGMWGYWAASLNGVYFADQEPFGGSARILFRSFGGGPIREIVRIGKPVMVGDSGFAISPDRRSLLYSQLDESSSDILVFDHFR